jgi:hypothetical protein
MGISQGVFISITRLKVDFVNFWSSKIDGIVSIETDEPRNIDDPNREIGFAYVTGREKHL